MQSHYPAEFERDTGGTETEWLARLPGACGAHAPVLGERSATVAIGTGHLQLQWQPLEDRRIALMRMPRLLVRFRFEGLTDSDRALFMRYFDLFMQRGGG